MRAMQLQALSTPLVPVTLALPVPGQGELRLSVRACGINFADTLIVHGRYQERPALPFVPGMEVAGVVDALGEGCAGPAAGTRVAAFAGHGGLAEMLCVPAAACVPLPEAMSDVEAAGFPIAYGTSHLALAEARLHAGERLLVLGAAGGVGLTAVQIGALMGAEVIACARGAEKLEVARAAGAHHLIDSEGGDLRERVKALGGADVVYDPVGGELFTAALRACNPGARMLPIGFASGSVPQIPANLLLVKNITVIGFYWGGWARHDPARVAASFSTLFGWYEEGLLKPHVSHVLPLERANEALDLIRTRAATGKVVVEIA